MIKLIKLIKLLYINRRFRRLDVIVIYDILVVLVVKSSLALSIHKSYKVLFPRVCITNASLFLYNFTIESA